MSPRDEDIAWVARIVAARDAGDPEPFAEIVERFAGRLTSVLRGYMGRGADVEDVLQDAFIKTYGSLHLYNGRSSLYTWIYRIAINASLDHRKRTRRHRAVSFSALAGTDESGPEIDVPGSERPAEERAGATERAEAIHAALAELPDRFREVLVLRELDGLSYEEISQALDLKKGTVESRLFRARAMLREIAERHHLEELIQE